MSLIDLVKQADKLQWSFEGDEPEILTLLPPLPAAKLAALEQALGAPLPADIRALLQFTSGFDNSPLETIDFSGGIHEGRESYLLPDATEGAFPNLLPVAHDGAGNYFAVEVRTGSAAWGPVWHMCHDPYVAVFHCDTFEQFLRDLVQHCKTPERGVMFDLMEKHCGDIWARHPGEQTAAACRASSDDTLKAFAAPLDDSWLIVDLRRAKTGDGVCLGRFGPQTAVTRCGHEKLFAYQTKTFGQRLKSFLFGR